MQHPAGGGRMYFCTQCHLELSFARVEVMTERMICFTCPCSPGVVARAKYPQNGEALRRLFGPSIRPVLPYIAAPRQSASLPPGLEAECASFARTWGYLTYLSDFQDVCAASHEAVGEPPVEDE